MSPSALAQSVADEWTALVSTAVVGTDRRFPPPPEVSWEVWNSSVDPAVALLDRAAAVVIARRAGACPQASSPGAIPVAPLDERPVCPVECATRLQRLLAGEHDQLLPEWLERCAQLGSQLPWSALPTLLLRGRRIRELDNTVRKLAKGRAEWLADVMPELGVRPEGTKVAPTAAAPTEYEWGPPAALTDSGVIMSAMVQVFADGLATWAAAPQLRLTVAALHPKWLPSCIAELSRLPFSTVTERTRADVVGLAEFRLAMLLEFDHANESKPASSLQTRPKLPAPVNAHD